MQFRFHFSHSIHIYRCKAKNEQEVKMLANKVRCAEKKETGNNLGKLFIIKQPKR